MKMENKKILSTLDYQYVLKFYDILDNDNIDKTEKIYDLLEEIFKAPIERVFDNVIEYNILRILHKEFSHKKLLCLKALFEIIKDNLIIYQDKIIYVPEGVL
jgi:hypothetical protein